MEQVCHYAPYINIYIYMGVKHLVSFQNQLFFKGTIFQGQLGLMGAQDSSWVYNQYHMIKVVCDSTTSECPTHPVTHFPRFILSHLSKPKKRTKKKIEDIQWRSQKNSIVNYKFWRLGEFFKGGAGRKLHNVAGPGWCCTRL